MFAHLGKPSSRAWRFGWPGALALASLAALALWRGDVSTAGDNDLAKESVTVTPELAWVSPDAALFATIRPAALWNSTEGKILREQFPDLAKNIEEDVEREVGLKPAEIERLTLVMPDWQLSGRRRYPNTIKPDFPAKEKDDFDLPRKEIKDPSPVAAQTIPVQPQPEPEWEPKILWIITATEQATLMRVRKEAMDNGMARTHKGKTFYTVKDDRRGPNSSLYFVNERSFVRGGVKRIEKGLERTDTETKGPLAPALRLAKEDHHLAVGLQLTDKDAGQLLEEIGDAIGRGQRGVGRMLMPLFRARAAAGFANVGKETRAEVQVFFRDGTQATAALPAAEDALALVRIHGLGEGLAMLDDEMERAENPKKEKEAMFGIQIVEQLESALRRFKSETKGSLLRVQALASTDLARMTGKTQDLIKARLSDEAYLAARSRRLAQNNLRQIGLAVHNIHDTYKHLPPADICDKLGLPLLSWRVAILPYIDQKELYDQFRIDEPWNSKHNIKLLEKMPKVFAAIGIKTKEPGLTFYQAFVADPKAAPEHQTAWETRPDASSPFGAWGPRMTDFTDGTSNTFLVVEAGEPVPWTKPADLPYDASKPLPKLGGVFKDGFTAVMADGWAVFIPRDLDEQTLRALITRAGGEQIGEPFYRLRR
jgi:hypothetical protein